MTARTPLFVRSDGDLEEFSSTELTAFYDYLIYLYAKDGNEPVKMTRKSANDSTWATFNDTRTQAGASTSRVDRFATAAETGNVSTVTVAWKRLHQTLTDPGSFPANPDASGDGVRYPLYYSGGNLYRMNKTDFLDTFIHPAIDRLIDGNDRPGTYRIHTSTSLAGHTAVSTSSIFTDTVANVSAYTASGIGETRDQPTNDTAYYLLRVNTGSEPSHQKPVHYTSNSGTGNVSAVQSEAFWQSWIRNTAYEGISGSAASTRVRYSSSTGNNRGSTIVNHKYNGGGNYQTRFVNANDYRTQEFPNGTKVAANNYYLKIGHS